jgi:hypothetical protein
LAQENHVSETIIKSASLEQLKKLREPIFDIPFHVYTEQIRSSTELEERIEDMFQMYGVDSKVIVAIDSFQAMDKIDKDDRVSIESWSYFLDVLKLKYQGKLTIISTSEKSKASYRTEELGGSKGSNALEYKNETILNVIETEVPYHLYS